MKKFLYALLVIIVIDWASCNKPDPTPTPTPIVADTPCNNQLIYGKYKSLGNGDTIVIGDEILNLNNKDGWCFLDSSGTYSYKSKYEYCVRGNNTLSIRYTGPCKILFIKQDILPFSLSNGILTFGTPTTNYQVHSLKNIANTKFVKI